MFQTLGFNSERSDAAYRALATLSSLAVVLGNVSVPVAVLTGLVR
jgi:hypothetical protein